MSEKYNQEQLYKAEHGPTERVEAFRVALEDIAVAPLHATLDISNESPAKDAANTFIFENRNDEPTLFLEPDLVEAIDEAEGLVGFQPYVVASSKTSGHGVFFGALRLGDGSEVEVAVKPHHYDSDDILDKRKMERSCLRDYFTNIAAHKAQFDGLKSIGFLLDLDGTPYSLTLLEEELSTYDSIDWTVLHKEGHETSGMRTLWDKAAMLVAHLHSTGDSFHGDLAPRNIGTNPEGQVFLIDWELGNVTTHESHDTRQRGRKLHSEMRKLMESMLYPTYKGGTGMFQDLKDVSWWDGFKDVFFDTYCDWRLGLAEQGAHHGVVLKETKAELSDLAEKLRMDVLMLEDRVKTSEAC